MSWMRAPSPAKASVDLYGENQPLATAGVPTSLANAYDVAPYDANGDVWPNTVIKAGAYTIIDSDPNTWSTNAESGHRGHAVVEGYPARLRPADGI